MLTQQRTISMMAAIDFAHERAQAPLVGFFIAAVLSATLWVTGAWMLSSLLG